MRASAHLRSYRLGIMKQILLFSTVFAAASAVLFHPDYHGRGVSSQSRNQNDLGHYNFHYDENHETGGTFRREISDGKGKVVGAYGLRDIDGRVRVVNYIADDAGFRVNLKSNEPGVEADDPAAVTINKPHHLISQVHPVKTYVPTPLLHASAPAYASTYPHRRPVKFDEYYYYY